jgi:hypothetical protein
MESFSEKYGFKPKRTILQTEDMDDELRISLWNVLYLDLWYIMKGKAYLNANDLIQKLVEDMWNNHLKNPIDSISPYWDNVLQEIRDYFFSCEFNEVYDFLQYIAEYFKDTEFQDEFTSDCNKIMERELSGYRFIGTTIAPVISTQEIVEVEEALDSTKSVASHLQTALDLLSDRESPDYRNSIKESISAVEAICALIADNKDATLGDALSIIQRKSKIDLHKSLRNAFDKLYEYTSDAEGIRHAILDEPNLHFEDAKFMLVSCSAFVNYLKMKVSKAEIEIEKS